jgi:predicted RNase H-like HicB family nuclease
MPDIKELVVSITASTLRQVVISPGEDGYFVAEVPSLPGCISQGRTRAEAITNVREAIALYIEVLEAQGTPIPEDTLERQLVVV